MRTFQEQNSGAESSLKIASGARHPAGRIVGPVAIEPDHAKFDAIADTCIAAVLDEGEIDGAHLAVTDLRLRRAEAARDVAGLPGAYCQFANICEIDDLQ